MKEFVSSDDTITIAALVAAVQHDTRGRVLDLGFDRIDVHPRIVNLYLNQNYFFHSFLIIGTILDIKQKLLYLSFCFIVYK